jgi:hypothetical protein
MKVMASYEKHQQLCIDRAKKLFRFTMTKDNAFPPKERASVEALEVVKQAVPEIKDILTARYNPGQVPAQILSDLDELCEFSPRKLVNC